MLNNVFNMSFESQKGTINFQSFSIWEPVESFHCTKSMVIVLF